MMKMKGIRMGMRIRGAMGGCRAARQRSTLRFFSDGKAITVSGRESGLFLLFFSRLLWHVRASWYGAQVVLLVWSLFSDLDGGALSSVGWCFEHFPAMLWDRWKCTLFRCETSKTVKGWNFLEAMYGRYLLLSRDM
jgi:hypothetical protein